MPENYEDFAAAQYESHNPDGKRCECLACREYRFNVYGITR